MLLVSMVMGQVVSVTETTYIFKINLKYVTIATGHRATLMIKTYLHVLQKTSSNDGPIDNYRALVCHVSWFRLVKDHIKIPALSSG